jgi:hypothetical protein
VNTRELGEYYEREFQKTIKIPSELSSGYCPEYDIKLSNGIQIEVKTENKLWKKYGNHYVEFYNKDKFKPSGISLTTSDYWVIALAVDKTLIQWIVVKTEMLKGLIGSNKWSVGEAKNEDDVNTLGFKIPIEELIKIEYKRN